MDCGVLRRGDCQTTKATNLRRWPEYVTTKSTAKTRDGSLEEAAEGASWDTKASCRRINKANIGSNYAISRQSYHWLVTNDAVVQKKIIADNDGAADSSCNKPETQWHVLWEWEPAIATR